MNQKEKRERIRELTKDIWIVNSYINNKMTIKERTAFENLRQLLLLTYIDLKDNV